MDRKGEAGAGTDALDEPVDGVGRERTAALGGKDERTVGELPAQLTQRPDLVAAERVRACVPFLARRAWSVALRPSSTCDHSRSAISLARSPCLGARLGTAAVSGQKASSRQAGTPLGGALNARRIIDSQ
jgi:hypothetical protein